MESATERITRAVKNPEIETRLLLITLLEIRDLLYEQSTRIPKETK